MLEAEIVTVELHGGLHEDWLNEHCVSAGSDVQERSRGIVEPLVRFKFNVVVTEPPAFTVPEAGFDEIEKSNSSA